MLAAAAAAGAVLGLLVTVTPLLLVAIALAWVTILAVQRDLAADERRAVTAIIVGALAARVYCCLRARRGRPSAESAIRAAALSSATRRMCTSAPFARATC